MCVVCYKQFAAMSTFTSEEIVLLGIALGTLSGLLKQQGTDATQCDRLSSLFKSGMADSNNKWLSQEDLQFIKTASAMYLEIIGLQNLSPKEEKLWLGLVDKFGN